MGLRLEWDGKPKHVERISLPFQTVETINESRATRERDTGALFSDSTPLTGDREPATRRNQLIWGDNKLVMSSLLDQFAGKVNLVYIDPPFATGDDFTHSVSVGDGSVAKLPSVLEEHAYRDTWGAGYESYLAMMYSRLVLVHELLDDAGSFYLHSGQAVSHVLRCLCDEIFGTPQFRNEIVWQRTGAHNDPRRYGNIAESILFYTKSDRYTWNVQRTQYSDDYIKERFRSVEEGTGRRYWLNTLTAPAHGRPAKPAVFFGEERFPPAGTMWRFKQEKITELERDGRIEASKSGMPYIKQYLDESEGRPLQNIWTDVPMSKSGFERTRYPTQKPEGLLERIIRTSSDEGDLVADFFAGSGTTAAVAEKLDRRWIACDLGRFAIHTTRKRLLNIPGCSPFEIKNLGSYERQRWQVAMGNGALRAYLDTILGLYRADPVEGFAHLHGRKAGRMVHVGATDAPVTIDETEDVMDEMADNGIQACDLLGWEWEMGLHDTITETARRRGLDLRPRQIPREVMERQITEADAVRFFELAHVDLEVQRQAHEASVVLTDFLIPSEELIPPKVREQISSWVDLVDYWSVDFDFSDDVFHNQWQTYRTREQPTLATQTDWHEYPGPGLYSIVVKIIDIFGNDTTKHAEVRIK